MLQLGTVDGPIYLDYNATTPVDDRVVAAMMPYFTTRFGNASSAHAYGIEARRAVEEARARVAELIGACPDEMIFTQGGSESDNLALKGIAFARWPASTHIVSSAVEHPAVLGTLQYLHDRFGCKFTIVPVDAFGMVSPDAVKGALRPNTALVSIMHANNEVGTVNPLRDIAEVVHAAGALLHVDASQSAGKMDVDVDGLGADLLTIAGHKLYAPKGIGALYLRRGVFIDPLVHGGGQEGGRRAGTENVPYIVALGAAATIARDERPEEERRLTRLRDALHDLLSSQVPGLSLNGHPTLRAPGTLNVSFPHVAGRMVLDLTPGVAASTGSACHSAAGEPSGVLDLMGLSRERAQGAVRLSLGRWTTQDDIEGAASALAAGYFQALDYVGLAG